MENKLKIKIPNSVYLRYISAKFVSDIKPDTVIKEDTEVVFDVFFAFLKESTMNSLGLFYGGRRYFQIHPIDGAYNESVILYSPNGEEMQITDAYLAGSDNKISCAHNGLTLYSMERAGFVENVYVGLYGRFLDSDGEEAYMSTQKKCVEAHRFTDKTRAHEAALLKCLCVYEQDKVFGRYLLMCCFLRKIYEKPTHTRRGARLRRAGFRLRH